jgi:hypothetical protein
MESWWGQRTGTSSLAPRVVGTIQSAGGVACGPQLSPGRFEGCVGNAALRNAASQKVGSHPQNLCPSFCVTRCCQCDSSTRYCHQTVVRTKWRNAHRGGVPLARSRRSSMQAKFLPDTVRPSEDTDDDGLVHLLASTLHVCQICLNLLVRSYSPSLPCQFTEIDQASRVLGIVPRSCAAPTATSRAGRTIGGPPSAQSDSTDS